jgi:hypothetical protein
MAPMAGDHQGLFRGSRPFALTQSSPALIAEADVSRDLVSAVVYRIVVAVLVGQGLLGYGIFRAGTLILLLLALLCLPLCGVVLLGYRPGLVRHIADQYDEPAGKLREWPGRK